ncbi:hypothetical protein [Bifidobacterium longum]
MVELVILLFVVLAVACFGLLLPFLRLAVGIVIILAASCLLTFALCRAATRRDEMEERWASAASCGQEKEERHETA